MPSNPVIRNISRDRLMAVFKDEDLVRVFEAVMYGVGTTLPANIGDVTGAADAAQATASSAQSNLNLHLADAIDAHDASSISVVPTGTFAVTDVQSAIALLASMAKQAANAVAITGGTIALASGSLGYAAGNGGTVTQATDKSTVVTLNKASGTITMNAAALAAGAAVTFTLLNSLILVADLLVVNQGWTGSTLGAYSITAACINGGAFITVRNLTAGSLSEAVVVRFAIVKAAET